MHVVVIYGSIYCSTLYRRFPLVFGHCANRRLAAIPASHPRRPHGGAAVRVMGDFRPKVGPADGPTLNLSKGEAGGSKRELGDWRMDENGWLKKEKVENSESFLLLRCLFLLDGICTINNI